MRHITSKSRLLSISVRTILLVCSYYLKTYADVAKAFDASSKAVIGLERLMLEASGFDFRVRYPHKHLMKFTKAAGVEKEVAQVAYEIMIDLYRTFAPLKQNCASMSLACIELATLVLDMPQSATPVAYDKFSISRAEVMETMLDLLDLYTHFQKSSIIGPLHDINKFIQIRIKLNQETEQDPSLLRYTEHHEPPRINGFRSSIKTPKTPITPASPSDARTNGKDIQSPATLSPRSAGSGRRGIGARGQEGTIRFMLDAEQAKQEKQTVSEYFKVEYEEYEVEVEEPIRHQRDERGPRGHPRHNGRDDRYHHKRPRY